jgi:hypothetical protein
MRNKAFANVYTQDTETQEVALVTYCQSNKTSINSMSVHGANKVTRKTRKSGGTEGFTVTTITIHTDNGNIEIDVFNTGKGA